MTGQNVIMNILTCHPERSEGSFAKESSKRFFADAQNDRNHITLNIKDLHKVLAGQRIASKIRKTLKHKGLRPSIKTQNEKLLKIPVQKQAIYRDHGGGNERRAGVRYHNVLLRMAEHEREQALS